MEITCKLEKVFEQKSFNGKVIDQLTLITNMQSILGQEGKKKTSRPAKH